MIEARGACFHLKILGQVRLWIAGVGDQVWAEVQDTRSLRIQAHTSTRLSELYDCPRQARMKLFPRDPWAIKGEKGGIQDLGIPCPRSRRSRPCRCSGVRAFGIERRFRVHSFSLGVSAFLPVCICFRVLSILLLLFFHVHMCILLDVFLFREHVVLGQSGQSARVSGVSGCRFC